MGIFSRKQQIPPPLAVGDLEERLRAIESKQRQFDADLDDLWDRFKRWTGRAAKREAVDHPVSHTDPREEINAKIRAQRARVLSNLNGGIHT